MITVEQISKSTDQAISEEPVDRDIYTYLVKMLILKQMEDTTDTEEMSALYSNYQRIMLHQMNRISKKSILLPKRVEYSSSDPRHTRGKALVVDEIVYYSSLNGRTPRLIEVNKSDKTLDKRKKDVRMD